jgi:predicted dehydrogenase
MQTIKAAVIGVGYLGRFHAQKYAQLDTAELVAVCDADIDNAQRVAEELSVDAVTDYKTLVGKVDAVSIVVPTQLHYEVAHEFLQAGTHVMLEKPITVTVEQAQALVDLAREKDVIFQVGHLERFNPAILALDKTLSQPLFIESHRVAPFNPRGADVSVILDLMIHDIDIILDIVDSNVTNISAKGVAVLSSDIDIANARLEFENGCVANVTASRAGMKSERKMRLFQHDAYITIDFQNKILGIHRKGDGEMFPGVANIESDEQAFEQGDALLSEIESFLNCIQTHQAPVVSGEDGKRALETAMEITRLLRQSNPQ